LFTKASLCSEEEHEAENHFCKTVQRAEDDRFIVRLPLKTNIHVLGQSKFMVQRRLLNLEQKLIRCSQLNTDYKVFMKEYVDLGHMTLIQEDTSVLSYYLPHHAVTKSDSITTKTRVVFDGSAAVTSTSILLNDVMMRGANVQLDLLAIFLRFHYIILH